jgi:hypothetical protein
LKRVEDKIQAERLPDALHIINGLRQQFPTEFEESDKAKHYAAALQAWRRGVVNLQKGRFTEAHLSGFVKSPTFQRLETTSDPSVRELVRTLKTYHDRVSTQVVQPSHEVLHETSPMPQENLARMSNVFIEATSILRDYRLATSDIDHQVTWHRQLENAWGMGDIESYHSTFRQFAQAYPEHPYRVKYQQYLGALRESSSATLLTPLPVSEGGMPPNSRVWIFVLTLIVLVVVGGAIIGLALPFIWNSGEGTPTGTPNGTLPLLLSETSPAGSSSGSTFPEDRDLLAYCREIEAHNAAEEWAAALQRAREARKALAEDLYPQAEEILQDCDLQAEVAKAGRNRAQDLYDAQEYGQVDETGYEVIEILNILSANDSNLFSQGDPRAVLILRQCARYQRSREAGNLSEAAAALETLARYRDTVGFNHYFALVCDFSYEEASNELAPTPTLTPTLMPTRTLTPTVETEEGQKACVPVAPSLQLPEEDAEVVSGDNVWFQWSGGNLCEEQLWIATIVDGQECPPTKKNGDHCLITVSPGTYQWRVEIRDASGEPIDADNAVSSPRTIIVLASQ